MSEHDPWRPPSGPPESQPRPGDTATQRKVLPAGRPILLLGLGGLLLSFPMPPVGIALDLAAILLGIRVLRFARRNDAVAPGAVGGILLASIGLGTLLLILALMGTELRTWADCMSGANTKIARDNCQQQLSDSLERRFGVRIP